MSRLNIALQRLYNQHIANPPFDKLDDVVKWLGAVQAQDYLGALWAVGLRTKNADEADVEQALADRKIVRTWPMRGTLHFVAAADVRWMLKLLAPRIIAGSAGRFRQLELDEAAFARSNKALVRALQGGKQLTRGEMYRVLESAHISTEGQRGIHILGRLAQEGLICFGARQGKQQTFVLLDEWVPRSTQMSREAALAELTRRYFASRGPATLKDYTWWSGLSTAQAREGIELAKQHLVQETFEGQSYWLGSSAPHARTKSPRAVLLPGFDEYLVGYTDRSAVLHPSFVKGTNAGGGMLNPVIVIDGQVAGTWKRTLLRTSVSITPLWFVRPKTADRRLLGIAAQQYGAFLGLPAEVVEMRAAAD